MTLAPARPGPHQAFATQPNLERTECTLSLSVGEVTRVCPPRTARELPPISNFYKVDRSAPVAWFCMQCHVATRNLHYLIGRLVCADTGCSNLHLTWFEPRTTLRLSTARTIPIQHRDSSSKHGLRGGVCAPRHQSAEERQLFMKHALEVMIQGE